jgi:hypothetical protein
MRPTGPMREGNQLPKEGNIRAGTSATDLRNIHQSKIDSSTTCLLSSTGKSQLARVMIHVCSCLYASICQTFSNASIGTYQDTSTCQRVANRYKCILRNDSYLYFHLRKWLLENQLFISAIPCQHLKCLA